jgi:hypothetical protein
MRGICYRFTCTVCTGHIPLSWGLCDRKGGQLGKPDVEIHRTEKLGRIRVRVLRES